MKLPICLLALAAASALAQSDWLQKLPTLPDFDSHRITSSDPTGGNADWRMLEPGQTLCWRTSRGPAASCTFEITLPVMSASPAMACAENVLGRRKGPSVEVPVGDFFGVGFGFTERMNSAFDLH